MECYRCGNRRMARTTSGSLECPDCGHIWQPYGVSNPSLPDNASEGGIPVWFWILGVVTAIAIAAIVAIVAILVAPRDAAPHFANCDEAEAVYGPGPFAEGHPAYRDYLDGDNDGDACEPYHPPNTSYPIDVESGVPFRHTLPALGSGDWYVLQCAGEWSEDKGDVLIDRADLLEDPSYEDWEFRYAPWLSWEESTRELSGTPPKVGEWHLSYTGDADGKGLRIPTLDIVVVAR